MSDRRPVVGGNWKMHTDLAAAAELADDVAAGLGDLGVRCDVAVFPPFPYLNVVGKALGHHPIMLGAQDLYPAASGAFTGEEVHILASTRHVGAVYRVISPFETTDGRRIMVDRGWIKPPQKDAERPAGPATITGNLHWPDEIDGFTPESDAEKNIWFARDVPTLADVLGTEPVLIILRETSETDPPVTPLPIDGAAIPNDHLEYVVTWYGLAIVWVLMTVYYLRRLRKTRKA